MKKRLSIILSSIIIFMSSTNVYASQNVPSTYFQTRDMILQFIQDVGYIGSLPVKGLQVMVTEFLNKMGLGEEAEEITSDEKALEWINNGVYVQGDQINVTGNQWLFFKDLMQTQKTANSYTIGYSTNYSRLSSDYQNVKNAFSSYQRTRICLPNGTGSMLLIPKQCYFVGNLTPNSSGYYTNLRAYYKGVQNIAGERVVYAWGSGASAWTQDYSNFNVYASSVSNNYLDPNQSFPTNYSVVGAEGFQYSFYVFQSASAVGDEGMPKYFVKDSYNTNMTKDSYNTTKHNVDNSLSYGDVVTYISENTVNGVPPSPTEINIYVNEYEPPAPTPTPTPTQGPDDGEGGSGDDEDTNIFDFLSRIGEVLGNLIKNLGNVLAELIEGIATTISSLFESIPTVFSDFLGGVIGWLPVELRALITLAISAMIIVGLIKLFRG